MTTIPVFHPGGSNSIGEVVLTPEMTRIVHDTRHLKLRAPVTMPALPDPTRPAADPLVRHEILELAPIWHQGKIYGFIVQDGDPDSAHFPGYISFTKRRNFADLTTTAEG